MKLTSEQFSIESSGLLCVKGWLKVSRLSDQEDLTAQAATRAQKAALVLTPDPTGLR